VHKLNILIYIYTGIYLLFSALTIATDVKEREPWWDVAADVMLLPLGGIGMLFFLLSVNDPSMKSVWKVISIIVVVGQLFSNVFSRHLTLAGKTDLNPEKITKWAILGADLTAIVLMAPMFALNILFAISGRRYPSGGLISPNKALQLTAR
jgi:hypothetical protein